MKSYVFFNRPHIDFEIYFKEIQNIDIDIYGCDFGSVPFIQKPNEKYLFDDFEYEKLRTINVEFNKLELKVSEYVHYGIYFTIWDRRKEPFNQNAITGTTNRFICINDLELLLEKVNYKLSEKQINYLNRNLKIFSTECKKPLFQLTN